MRDKRFCGLEMNDKWERSELPDVLGGEVLGVEFEFIHGGEEGG